MGRLWNSYFFLATALTVTVGCATEERTTSPVAAAGTDSDRTPVTQRSASRNGRRGDDLKLIQQRAEKFWDAKTKEDWDTVFLFEDPNTSREWKKEDFAAWSEKNDPFKILKYEFGQIQSDGEMGWVEVKYNSLVRRFQNVPPRDATLWQKWRKVNGEWYPVPLRELVAYPEPPARRDLGEESRLRERFMLSWKLRQAKDWKGLFELVDPSDRPRMPEEAWLDMHSLLEYLSYDVKWVEAIGQLGRVHVVYKRKVTDPSLSKLPVETAVETEEWIMVNNEWYRDLARASGPGAKNEPS